jgi:hypothetical protein
MVHFINKDEAEAIDNVFRQRLHQTHANNDLKTFQILVKKRNEIDQVAARCRQDTKPIAIQWCCKQSMQAFTLTAASRALCTLTEAAL